MIKSVDLGRGSERGAGAGGGDGCRAVAGVERIDYGDGNDIRRRCRAGLSKHVSAHPVVRDNANGGLVGCPVGWIEEGETICDE